MLVVILTVLVVVEVLVLLEEMAQVLVLEMVEQV